MSGTNKHQHLCSRLLRVDELLNLIDHCHSGELSRPELLDGKLIPLTAAQRQQFSFLAYAQEHFLLVVDKGKKVERLDAQVMISYEKFNVRRQWGCFLKANILQPKIECIKI